MKKRIFLTLLLGAIVLLPAVLWYQKQTLVKRLRSEVDKILTQMQSNGFRVKTLHKSDDSARYVVTLRDPVAAKRFFAHERVDIDTTALALLQGVPTEIDLRYAPNLATALQSDIAPLSLPKALYEKLQAEDPDFARWLQQRLKEKLLHITSNINALGSAVFGDIRDVNLSYRQRKIALFGAHYGLTLNEGKVLSVKSYIDKVKLADEKGDLILEKLHNTFFKTGTSAFDYGSKSEIETLRADANNIALLARKLLIETHSKTEANATLSSEQIVKIKEIEAIVGGKNERFEGVSLITTTEGVDTEALRRLQEAQSRNDDEAQQQALLDLIAKGIALRLQKFAVEKLTLDKETVDGFYMHGSFTLPPNDNRRLVAPQQLLSQLNASLELVLSNALYDIASRYPQVALGTMLIPPEDRNGTKAFRIDYRHGKVRINGKRLFSM